LELIIPVIIYSIHWKLYIRKESDQLG
jgi:hypothetical protein